MHVFCHRLSGCAAALLLLGCFTVASGNSLGDLRGLKTKDSRFPIYNKDRLQLMIYSAETERNGNLIATTDPIMDIIRRDADVDDVAATGKTVLYPLNAPLKEILSFWAKRLYSEGVISSKHADIDQENKIAGGSEEVYLRSPLIDLNGVGFEANFDKRTVLVKKDVHIVVRMNASDPREIVKTGKLPEKYEFLTASSNSMFLDFVKNEIRLIGNVKVKEPRADISCDVLTIYLDKDQKGKSSTSSDDLAGEISGVSRIVCEGNVVISRHTEEEKKKEEPAPVQRGSADRVVYELGEGLITLTGLPGKQPLLEHDGSVMSGNEIVIHRDKERMQLYRNCRMLFAQANNTGTPTTLTSDNMDLDYRQNQGMFTGNVKVTDDTTQMDCPRMKVTLREIPGSVSSSATDSTSTTSLMPGLATGNRRELDQITCLDNVSVVHKEKTVNPSDSKMTTKVTARGSTYDYRNNILHFEGDVKVRDPRMELDCDKLSLVFDRRSSNSATLAAAGDMLRGGKSELSRIITTGNVKIRNFSNPAAAAKIQKVASTLTAKNGFVDLKNNVTEFDGDVQIRDPRMKLDCDKLKIFTVDSGKESNDRADMGQLLAAPGSGGKSVERIECIGNVRTLESRGKLASDNMNLYFAKVKENTVPSALRSGDTELVKITCDGNVKLENIPQVAKQSEKQGESESAPQLSGMFKRGSSQPMMLTADRGIMDLKNDLSEFHGNVNVKEEQTSLSCRSLYLQAQPTKATVAAVTKKPVKLSAEDEIDLDPIEKEAESDIPSQLSIGEGRELKDVIADKDVVITRIEPGSKKPQTALGDRAHYVVADRKITLTGTPEERPILRDPQQGEMRGRKVIVDLARERMLVEEDTQLDLDGNLGKIDIKNLQ